MNLAGILLGNENPDRQSEQGLHCSTAISLIYSCLLIEKSMEMPILNFKAA